MKTNIGHLEAAAGVAGVMKVVLALRNERIPPHLHFYQAESASRLFTTAVSEIPVQARAAAPLDNAAHGGREARSASAARMRTVVLEEPAPLVPPPEDIELAGTPSIFC